MAINQNKRIFVVSKSNRLSSDYRRLAKPMMEKRRRARINNSLNELKYLILKALNKDPTGHNKLEKANILEMTVNYLQSISPYHLFYSYQAGYNHCIAQVSMFLSSSSLSSSCKRSLLIHLNDCLNKMRLTSYLSTSFNRDANSHTWYKKYSILSDDVLFKSLQLSINKNNYHSQPNLYESANLSPNFPFSPTASSSFSLCSSLSSSSSSLVSLSTSSQVRQWECKESIIWRPW